MELAKYARRSPALSVALLALDLCLYAAMVAGTIWAGDIWLKLIFAVGAGTMIALTAIVGHDAGHQSFSNNARLNRICGTLAFLPALHPFSLWKYHHNRIHHVYTAQLGVDNAFPPLTVDQYMGLPSSAKARYRFIRSLWGQPFFYLLDVWLPDMFLPFLKKGTQLSHRERSDIALVYAWLAAFLLITTSAIVSIHGHGWAGAFAIAFIFCWAIPFLIWNAFISFLSVVQHTAPDLRWSKPTGRPSTVEQAMAGTVHMQFPEWIDRMMHRIMQHPVHHLNVGIPLQELKEAQSHLAASEAGNHAGHWNLKYHLALTRKCQLYDPDQNRWVTFEEAERRKPELAKAA
jgi:omega-6 fatty acid desaturase (delta-12 desaturase)